MTNSVETIESVRVMYELSQRVDLETNHRIDFSMIIGRVDELLGEAEDGDVDLIMNLFVEGLILAGDYKLFRLQLVGKDGDGGWWFSNKVTERRRREPEIYSGILVAVINGMGEMADIGGSMTLVFYQELCGMAKDLIDKLPSDDDKRKMLSESVIEMTKIGLRHTKTLKGKLSREKIDPNDLNNVTDLDKLVKNIFETICRAT